MPFQLTPCSGVLIKLFDIAVSKAYPTFQQHSYTAITHHMMINGDEVSITCLAALGAIDALQISTTRLAALGAIEALLSDRMGIVFGLDHGASS